MWWNLNDLTRFIPDQEPLVANPRPIIEDLATLNEQRPVGMHFRGGRGEYLGQPLFTHHIHYEDSPRSETLVNIAEHSQVLVLVIEIAEGRKHVEHQVVRCGPHKTTHVLLHKLNV